MRVTIYKNDIPDDFHIDGDLAIDTETMGLNLNRDRLCVLQFSSGDGEAFLIQFTDKQYDCPNLKKLLLDDNRGKIFHYARFDLLAIRKYLGIDLHNVFCTKIASKLVRTYTDQHSLKELCRELLGINLSKLQQSSYWAAEELTKDQKEYAARDVLYLHSLRAILLERLIETGRNHLANEIFKFLSIRIQLDELGWEETDFMSYK